MAAEHYTYFESLQLRDYFTSIGVDYGDVQKVTTGIAIGIVLLVVASQAGRAVTDRRRRLGEADGVVPESRLSIAGAFDLFVETFVAFQDSILGKENRKYLPITGTVFLYIFACNLIGLIPGVPAATTGIWITVPIALFIFLSFNIYGVKENGAVGYIKHFAGPVWWLAWFIFPVEIFGTALRILTLNLRLYWNVTADHMVLGIFTYLTHYIIPIIFYGLGTFVSFMQAFVPTVLTMVYILLATQHEESEQH